MTELVPYPEYKDSGVEWLGETPSHWGRAQLRRVATIVNGGTPTPDEANWGGSVMWATPVDLNTVDGHAIESTLRTLTMEGLASGSALVPSGSVILSTRAPIGYSAMTRSPVAFNQGCKGLIPSGSIDPRFMLVTVQAAKAELARRGQGTTFLELSSSALGSIDVPLAPLEEQLAIAEFVERETAEIDAFIADQEELIGLLAERRAATITHAVTKGLDPSAPMKDSGVEWLGEVPASWVVGPMSRWCTVTLGKMLDAGKPAPDGSEPRPYLRAANIRPGWISLDSVYEMPMRPAEVSNLNLLAGDLLVVEGGATVGMNAIVLDDMPGWTYQKTVNRVRSARGPSTRFIGYYLDVLRYRGVIEMISSASTFQHLTAEKLGALTLAAPGATESATIADYLDHETAELDATIADAREAIALSKERRAALISAAVTGKIDVRGRA